MPEVLARGTYIGLIEVTSGFPYGPAALLALFKLAWIYYFTERDDRLSLRVLVFSETEANSETRSVTSSLIVWTTSKGLDEVSRGGVTCRIEGRYTEHRKV